MVICDSLMDCSLDRGYVAFLYRRKLVVTVDASDYESSLMDRISHQAAHPAVELIAMRLWRCPDCKMHSLVTAALTVNGQHDARSDADVVAEIAVHPARM